MAGVFWRVIYYKALKNVQKMMLVTAQNWGILFFWDRKKIPFIDFFFPLFFFSSSGASVVAIDNKIEQAMVCTVLKIVCTKCGHSTKCRVSWDERSASVEDDDCSPYI